LVCDVDAASIPCVDVGNLNFEVAYGCFSATSILLSKPACFFRMLDETLWIEMSLFTAMWAFALICKSCLQLIALFLFVFSIAVWTLVRALATSPISLLVCQRHFLLVPRSRARERERDQQDAVRCLISCTAAWSWDLSFEACPRSSSCTPNSKSSWTCPWLVLFRKVCTWSAKGPRWLWGNIPCNAWI
jgi:hypothetical protein